MELSNEAWDVVYAIILLTLWGLTLWADEAWCKKHRSKPDSHIPSLSIVMGRIAIILTFFITSTALVASGVYLLARSVPILLGY